jgi:hypothetical protein
MRKLRLTIALLIAVLVTGCAAWREPPLPLASTADGTAVWGEEYAFVPPPPPWRLLGLPETDYAFAFHKTVPGLFPGQSTFAYAEEPFGYSRDLRERCGEFFRRFLWAAPIRFTDPTIRPVEVLGGEGLEATAEGVEQVQGQKVFARVIFGRRGERVVAFYFTQWRPAGVPYDLADLEAFERFVQSFRFLRPSFYQQNFPEGR